MSAENRYWDSDAFLGWLQAEPGKEDLCRGVLEAAEGKVLIVTSALTVAEVLALRHKPKVPAAMRHKVAEFFKNKYITVHNLTRQIAEHARDLVWDHGIEPKDAVHVATALTVKVPLLNTFDCGLLKKTNTLGSPLLRIETPNYPGQTQLFGTKK